MYELPWVRWLRENPVPQESIYLWMYSAGLYAVPEQELFSLLIQAGKEVRQKDIDNYHRGLSNSYQASAYHDERRYDSRAGWRINQGKTVSFCELNLNRFERSDDLHDYEARWVPCNHENKPMVQWSQTLMTREEASNYPGAYYLAETLVDTPFIVLDIDGDHGGRLHLDLINAFKDLIPKTHCLFKQKFVGQCAQVTDPSLASAPTSFHLMFYTDRVIPTKHFINACVDLLGNKKNQLRYRKTKVWNGVYPAKLDAETWRYAMDYIGRVERQMKGYRNARTQ